MLKLDFLFLSHKIGRISIKRSVPLLKTSLPTTIILILWDFYLLMVEWEVLLTALGITTSFLEDVKVLIAKLFLTARETHIILL